MNREHLLDAIGLLDDDLVREAEEYSRPQENRAAWLGWAASFAVVLALGYGLTHIGMGGGASNTSGAPMSPAGASPSASAPDASYGGWRTENVAPAESPDGSAPQGGENWGEPASSNAAGGYDPSAPDASFTPPGAGSPESEYYVVRICITEGNVQYAYHCRFDGVAAGDPQVEVPQLEALPEGCRSLGRLRQMETEEDFKLPHTDSGWYTGCPLWIQGDGWEGPVYLELPRGGYLVFEYSQTYDLSP